MITYYYMQKVQSYKPLCSCNKQKSLICERSREELEQIDLNIYTPFICLVLIMPTGAETICLERRFSTLHTRLQPRKGLSWLQREEADHKGILFLLIESTAVLLVSLFIVKTQYELLFSLAQSKILKHVYLVIFLYTDCILTYHCLTV